MSEVVSTLVLAADPMPSLHGPVFLRELEASGYKAYAKLIRAHLPRWPQNLTQEPQLNQIYSATDFA